MKEISENASQVFDIIAGEDNKQVYKDFNKFHDELKNYVDYFDKQISESIANLSKILNNLNFIFVPLKNFTQNLLTLNFLTTNLKLNIGYWHDNESTLQEEIREVDDLIAKIKKTSPNIDDDLRLIKGQIKKTLQKLEVLKKTNTSNIETILEETNRNINYLTEKHEEAVFSIPKLAEITENSSENVSEIITKLQYHDIIKQKMTHIQETYKSLLEELNLLDKEQSDNIILYKQAKYVSQIPNIAELQIAQLIYANREYQQAIQIIVNNFFEIADDMQDISDMCIQISSNTKKQDETHFEKIEENLQKLAEVIGLYANTNIEFNEEIEKINMIANNVNENFQLICKLDKVLHDITFKIIDINKMSSPHNELSKIAIQIKGLSHDILSNINNGQLLLNQTISISKKLQSNISEYTSSDHVISTSEKLSQNI